MKRYNCKDFPAEMVESDDGYWVTCDDATAKYDEHKSSCIYLMEEYNHLLDDYLTAARTIRKLESISMVLLCVIVSIICTGIMVHV